MVTTFAHAVSLAAFLGCALCAARLLAPASRRGAGAQPAVAALACFAFLPAGVLPPLLNVPVSGLFCLILYWGSVAATQAPARRSACVAAAALTLCFGALAGFAFLRGLPGSALNLGTFVAMPAWGMAGWAGRTGLVCLAASLALAAPRTCSSIQRLAFWAIGIACLLPLRAATLYPGCGFAGVVADFILFWLLAVCLAAFFRKPQNAPAWATGLLAAAGAALLLLPAFP